MTGKNLKHVDPSHRKPVATRPSTCMTSLAYAAQMLSRYAAIDPDMTDGILDKVLSAKLKRAALAAPF